MFVWVALHVFFVMCVCVRVCVCVCVCKCNIFIQACMHLIYVSYLRIVDHQLERLCKECTVCVCVCMCVSVYTRSHRAADADRDADRDAEIGAPGAIQLNKEALEARQGRVIVVFQEHCGRISGIGMSCAWVACCVCPPAKTKTTQPGPAPQSTVAWREILLWVVLFCEAPLPSPQGTW
jgi:hypothetical protein